MTGTDEIVPVLFLGLHNPLKWIGCRCPVDWFRSAAGPNFHFSVSVADKWLNCIQVFSPDGNYLRQMGAKGTSPGHFRSPEGIAVDARGFIYVADTCNDRVQVSSATLGWQLPADYFIFVLSMEQVLDRDGVFVRELGRVMQMTLPGGRLYQKREFNEPTGVAVSSSGDRIAVCDFGNCRIKVFGANGERLASFGFRGTQRGQFQKPECVVMDEMGKWPEADENCCDV